MNDQVFGISITINYHINIILMTHTLLSPYVMIKNPDAL